MRTHLRILAAALVPLAACSSDVASGAVVEAPTQTSATRTATSEHGPGDDLHWMPAPAPLPPGAEIAVLQGDPGGTEPFTIRLRFPNGYRIPPHIHPTIENVTVLSGTFLAGMGTRFNTSEMKEFRRDAFISIPADHPHFAMARGLTIVQLHAVGPFSTTLVDPNGEPIP